ncbi:class I SAM-dependent methyltransferase, partial [Streptomyces specialis]|uniref:class I SAM-dependent methyltransferase n=1 Tax=Streptomyces specialis TaxID=498367 RepID=UPI000A59AD16
GRVLAAVAAEPAAPSGEDPARPPAALARATARWAARAFAELLPDTPEFGLDDLRRAGLREEYARHAALLAAQAVEHGLLDRVDGGPEPRWRRTAPPDTTGHTASLLTDHPDAAAELALHTHCGARLPAVLRGTADPQALLAAEGARHLCEYVRSRALRAPPRRARPVLAAAVADWPADRPLRVLELGGGTGELAAALLPGLPPDRTECLFTDIGAAPFPRARARLAAYDTTVDYRRFDPAADASRQDVPGGFGLIVDSGALHATADPVATVRRVAALLAPGGQVLTLTGGASPAAALFHGLFAKDATRGADGTGPEPRAALAEAGLTDIVAWGEATGTAVLLARRGDLPHPTADTPHSISSPPLNLPADRLL